MMKLRFNMLTLCASFRTFGGKLENKSSLIRIDYSEFIKARWIRFRMNELLNDFRGRPKLYRKLCSQNVVDESWCASSNCFWISLHTSIDYTRMDVHGSFDHALLAYDVSNLPSIEITVRKNISALWASSAACTFSRWNFYEIILSRCDIGEVLCERARVSATVVEYFQHKDTDRTCSFCGCSNGLTSCERSYWSELYNLWRRCRIWTGDCQCA